MNTRFTLSQIKAFFSLTLLLASFSMFGQVSLTATAGTATGSFTTLKGAFDAINAGTHQGAIVISITGNTTETATASLNNSGAATTSYTSVLIQPSGGTWTIAGSVVGAIIKLNGADNVTIDGRISGSGRNLTIQNTSTSGSTAAVWLASVAAGNGVTGSTVRNCELLCGATQNTLTVSTFGIIMSGTTISTTANGTDNDNNTFTENRIIRCRYGITTRGTTTNLNETVTVTNNIIGPIAFGADQIGKVGIFMQADNNALVSGNTVQYVGGDFANTTGGSDRMGIAIGNESWSTSPGTITSTNYTVTRNIVGNVVEERTFSAVGINLATTNGGAATNNLVANNFIYQVKANGTIGDQTVGLGIAGGHSDKVVFNTISLTGDVDPNPLASATTNYGSGIRIANANGTTHLNLTLRNNIVNLDLSSSSAPTVRYYAISGNSNSYAFGTGGQNFNSYYINPTNPQLQTGGLGSSSGVTLTTQFATLTDWKTAYTAAQDANSISANPTFVSATNLHLVLASATAFNGTGVTVAGVIDDIDGDFRKSTPDIGADEFNPVPPCSGTPIAGTINSVLPNLCTGNTGTNLSLSGATSAPGISYQWASSATAGGPYTNLGTAPTQATGALAATTYYVVSVTCSSATTAIAVSPEFTLSVNTTPTVTVSATMPVCLGSAINLMSTTDVGTTFAWAGPASFAAAIQNPSIAVSAATNTGTYTVTVTNNGCTKTATVSVAVNAIPTGVTAATSAPTTCIGTTIDLTGNGVGLTAANTYVFAASAGTFTPLTGATAITFPNAATDDAISAALPIGFSFPYDGAARTQMRVSTNGNISFNIDAVSAALNNLATGTTLTRPLIAPLWDDLDAVGGVSSLLEGTAPNRTLTVQWLNAKWYWDASGPVISFQAKIYETSGKIEYVYRQEANPVFNTFASASIGLSGIASGNFLSLSGSGAAPTVSATTETTTINTKPATGQIYTFTPQVLSYAWTSTPAGFTSAVQNPLAVAPPVGTNVYTVVATNGFNCTASAAATVTVNPAIVANGSQTPVSCFGTSTGIATVAPTGGNGTFAYTWSNGATTASATALPTGIYVVTITSDGCSTTASVTVTEPSAVVLSTPTVNDVSCNGGNNGAITIAATGGTAPYTYTPALTGLTAGPYTVTVTDANGCSATANASITEPTAVTATAAEATPVSCDGGSDGTAIATPAGGTAPYTYAWSMGGTAATTSALAAGTYTATVTDANGCTASATAMITQPNAIVVTLASQTNVLCNGGNNGAVVLTATGGNGGYMGLTQMGLLAGLQTLTVTDSKGCSGTVMVTIAAPTALTATATQTTAATCNGASDGVAQANGSGGVMPYTYAWSNGGTIMTASGLAAGVYVVTVTDANACTTSQTVTVSQPTAVMATATGVAPTCATGAYQGTTNGTASVVAAGGTAGYTYMWSTGSMSAGLTALAAGSYTVTVTDANGCTSVATAVVPEGTANTSYYQDADYDGFGNAAVSLLSCDGTPTGYVANDDDCNVTNPNAYPGAPEVCGSVADLNCDGQVGFTPVAPTLVSQTVTGTSATLSFSGSCAFRYRVQVRKTGTTSWKYYYVNGAGTSVNVSGLTPGTYQWTVRAQGGPLTVYTTPVATANSFTIN